MRVAVLLTVLLVSCGIPAPATNTRAAAASPTATPSPTPRLAPSPSPSGVPTSAGAVPDAGTVFVWGADDGIYRYDGATGSLTRVSGMSSLDREMAFGVYVLGRHGGITLLRWDGTRSEVCGGGPWADVSTRGNCANTGSPTDGAVYTDSAEGANGAALPRMLLPADWGATQFVWDLSGLQLAIVRHEARPEPVRVHQTLWVMDIRHGTLRKVFDSPSATSFLSRIQWSPRTNQIAFFEQTNTSASAVADGAGSHLWVVDPVSAVRRDLGTTLLKGAWVRWSPDGRLAFVRGGGRETWGNKEVVVLDPDGTERIVSGRLTADPTPTDRAALAPAWQPTYAGGKLAWIEGPAMTIEASPDYFRGTGPSAQRVAVLDGGARVTCPGRVTEGVRWSADGTSLLLLCRVRAVEQHALEIWYAPLGGRAQPLVTGLGDLGFGYYGMQPSLFELAAWSLAVR